MDYIDKALAIDQNNVYALSHKGNLLFATGNHSEAWLYFDKALVNTRYLMDAQNNIAYTLTLYSNDYSKALELIDKSLEHSSNNIYSMDTKALVLDQLGRHKEAVEWYDKVLALEPKFIVSLNNKGVALANLGHYKQALKWYDYSLKQIPGDLDMISNKARILGLELEYSDALKLLNTNLKINPNHKGLLCNKAEILEKMGHKDAAILLKEKLVELYSDNYKCGYFKKTKFSEIAGEPFV